MNNVEVLPTSLADNSRVPSESSLDDTLRDFTVQVAEYSSRAGVVKACELFVCQNDLGNFFRITRDELDNVGWEAGFEEDLMKEIIAVDGRRRRFPDDHITHEGWRSCEIAPDGSEIEGGDGVDKPLKSTVFDTASEERT